ncbi:hypothetical protein PHISP_07491 [Aspergillus sp. HF37]|nr:hypothetical protein PHISP_07491 [Aspergillus sp. HF37]
MSVLNYFITGWYNPYLDKYYMNSWQVFLGLLVVFSLMGNVCLAVIRCRLGQAQLLPALIENFKWMPLMALFFGGLSFHLILSILAHMFQIDITWSATSKEKEDTTFFREVPKVLKHFKWLYVVMIPLIICMIYLGCFAPSGWTITKAISVVPLNRLTKLDNTPSDWRVLQSHDYYDDYDAANHNFKGYNTNPAVEHHYDFKDYESYTSTTACPTPFEVGTNCDFINPQYPCAPQPGGYGPHVTPDTVYNFKHYEPFHALASNASIPDTYGQTFEDLDAAVNANTYLGYQILESYDVDACADICNDDPQCSGFNIYIERDPSINSRKCSCKDPPSITNYKCSIWGSGVTAAAATNDGQNRGDFEVVIVASNGYAKI